MQGGGGTGGAGDTLPPWHTDPLTPTHPSGAPLPPLHPHWLARDHNRVLHCRLVNGMGTTHMMPHLEATRDRFLGVWAHFGRCQKKEGGGSGDVMEFLWP